MTEHCDMINVNQYTYELDQEREYTVEQLKELFNDLIKTAEEAGLVNCILVWISQKCLTMQCMNSKLIFILFLLQLCHGFRTGTGFLTNKQTERNFIMNS